MAKAKNEAAGVNASINVTPMVDVMLVLLIIFMVITPMLHPYRPVDLAKTDHPVEMPDADRDDALIVAVVHDGTIFIGNEMVTGETLTQRIRSRLGERSTKRFT